MPLCNRACNLERVARFYEWIAVNLNRQLQASEDHEDGDRSINDDSIDKSCDCSSPRSIADRFADQPTDNSANRDFPLPLGNNWFQGRLGIREDQDSILYLVCILRETFYFIFLFEKLRMQSKSDSLKCIWLRQLDWLKCITYMFKKYKFYIEWVAFSSFPILEESLNY